MKLLPVWAFWFLGQFHLLAQSGYLSIQSLEGKDRIDQANEFPPEPWEYQEKPVTPRTYTKPISLSERSASRKPQPKDTLKSGISPLPLNEPSVHQVSKSEIPIPPENTSPEIAPIKEAQGIHPGISDFQNLTPPTEEIETIIPETDNRKPESITIPAQTTLSDASAKDHSIPEEPKRSASSEPGSPAISKAPQNKPVITSLDKNIPSLTRFNARREKPSVNLLPRWDLMDSLDFSFIPFQVPITWVDQAPVLTYPITSESIHLFKTSWPSETISAIHQALIGFKPLLPQSDGIYYAFVYESAKKIYPNRLNEARLLTELLMKTAGFKVGTAYQKSDILLMVNTAQPLYEVTRITSGSHDWQKEDWFFWEPGVARQIQGDFFMPGVEAMSNLKSVNLSIHKQSDRIGDTALRVIDYFDSVTKTRDTFRIQIDKDLVKILGALPQMSPEIYFDAPVSFEVYKSLIEPLKSRVSNMRSYESLGWLLRFVQQAFPYRTDEEQFGKEKAMFLEEALIHAYTDCEDRSVLFAILVREVLGRNVIGLDFPGHMAVGVETKKQEARGARIKYKGRIYMACDPSYINGIPGNLPGSVLKHNPKPIILSRPAS